jgi:hypothetical protein
VVGPRFNRSPEVKVFDAFTTDLIDSIMAFSPNFLGGVNVACGDFDGDKKCDFAVAAGAGNSPHVVSFKHGGELIHSFYAYDSQFLGGLDLAACDLNWDGIADYIGGAGFGAPPHVVALSGKDLGTMASFYAYSEQFKGGISVTADNIKGSFQGENWLLFPRIITIPGQGAPPHAVIFKFTENGNSFVTDSFYFYDPRYLGGSQITTSDLNSSGIPSLITGAANSNNSHVVIVDGLIEKVEGSFLVNSNFATMSGFAEKPSTSRYKNTDTDNDGLPDKIESNYFGSDPNKFDTDGDLIPDAIEWFGGRSVFKAEGANLDSDNDGISDMNEVIFGTKLHRIDSDSDGVLDNSEIQQGSDPNDPTDYSAPQAKDLIELRLTVGDDSSSQSERYNLIVGEITHQATEFGVVSSQVYKFKRGRSYKVQIEHRGTNQSSGPDFDYLAKIETIGQGSIDIKDPDGILGSHSESDYFYAAGKYATLTIPKNEADYQKVELKFMAFIPSPAVPLLPPEINTVPTQVFTSQIGWATSFGGDNRTFNYNIEKAPQLQPNPGYRAFQKITLDLNPNNSIFVNGEKDWGTSHSYLAEDAPWIGYVDGFDINRAVANLDKPWWWHGVNTGAQYHDTAQLAPTMENNRIEYGRIDSETVYARFVLAGSLPLSPIPLINPNPQINASITVILKQKPGENAFFSIEGNHDGFPAYELYVNGYKDLTPDYS